jgi:hypothetical protein
MAGLAKPAPFSRSVLCDAVSRGFIERCKSVLCDAVSRGFIERCKSVLCDPCPELSEGGVLFTLHSIISNIRLRSKSPIRIPVVSSRFHYSFPYLWTDISHPLSRTIYFGRREGVDLTQLVSAQLAVNSKQRI